ncbi:hypothetical protein JKP88DRAFT_275476 [Tribonema minus]|uniref:Peptidase S54 rhomboid domain-containing protein n=1 Tax=Tribonema minus TaxID=303371 RepID=A0A835ZCA5_9STRA|nr:hypothetical protein JKP88DRAFT_275476 [Tribonema minus]
MGRLLFGDQIDVCLYSAWTVVELRWEGRVDWVRLFGSSLVHVDRVHLGINMVTLFRLGTKLEGAKGSVPFACIVAVLWVLSSLVQVALPYALHCAGFDGWYYSCALGSCGVLIALGCVVDRRSALFVCLVNVLMPANQIAWAALAIYMYMAEIDPFIMDRLFEIMAAAQAKLLNILRWVGGAFGGGKATTQKTRLLQLSQQRSGRHWLFGRRVMQSAQAEARATVVAVQVPMATAQAGSRVARALLIVEYGSMRDTFRRLAAPRAKRFAGATAPEPLVPSVSSSLRL